MQSKNRFEWIKWVIKFLDLEKEHPVGRFNIKAGIALTAVLCVFLIIPSTVERIISLFSGQQINPYPYIISNLVIVLFIAAFFWGSFIVTTRFIGIKKYIDK